MSKFISDESSATPTAAANTALASDSQPGLKPAGSFSMKNLQKALMTPNNRAQQAVFPDTRQLPTPAPQQSNA